MPLPPFSNILDQPPYAQTEHKALAIRCWVPLYSVGNRRKRNNLLKTRYLSENLAIYVLLDKNCLTLAGKAYLNFIGGTQTA